MKPKTNVHYKDRLWRAIFSNKKYLLSLYNCLNDSNYTNTDDLEITTIQDVIYIKMKNDTSFMIDDELHLYEQQSTYNPNMPLRGLMYFSQLYQDYLSKQQTDIYSTKLIKLPTPHYVVFYNGVDKTDIPDIMELRLSDAFIKSNESRKFEWTATMLNINKGHNKPLLEKCYPLNDYATYVDKVREFLAKGLKQDVAIDEAVNFAIKSDLLDGFFKQQKQEVVYMSLTEFDQKEYDRNRRKEAWDDGVAWQKAQSEKIILQMNHSLSQRDAEIAQLRAENVALKSRLQ